MTLESLRVRGRQGAGADSWSLLRDWLRDSRHGDWLVILDNVDDAHVVLNAPGNGQSSNSRGRRIDFFPSCDHGSVLITSRYRHVATKVVRDKAIIRIEALDEQRAQSLIVNKLQVKHDQNDVVKLVQLLGCMPLALTQAATYINRRAPRCTVPEYLARLDDDAINPKNVLEKEEDDTARDPEASNSIVKTLSISLAHISHNHKNAARLLSVMSFFDRQAIPMTVLQESVIYSKERTKTPSGAAGAFSSTTGATKVVTRTKHATETAAALDDDLTTLTDYSFVSPCTDGETFEMHRLVQVTVQLWLRHEKDQIADAKNDFIDMMLLAFPIDEISDFATCRSLFPHAARAIAISENDISSSVLKSQKLLALRCARHMLGIGRYDESERLAIGALSYFEQQTGPDRWQGVECMIVLALVKLYTNRLDGAEQDLVHVMQEARSAFGEKDDYTTSAMAHLGQTYMLQSRFEEAKNILELVLKLRTAKYGEDHEILRAPMMFLASAYRESGDLEKAENLYKLALSIHEKQKDTVYEHPAQGVTLRYHLARTYTKQRRFHEAEILLHKALEASTIVHGEGFHTLVTMDLLADCHAHLGWRQSSIELSASCADKSTKSLGIDHSLTIERRERLRKRIEATDNASLASPIHFQ